MSRNEALAQVRKVLAETAPASATISETEIGQKHLMQDLGMDSLDVISLLFRLEEVFGMKIPEADVDNENLMLVGNLAAYLGRKGSDGKS